METTDDDRLACATYTHARRHPMVLGKIGDWTPPFQITLPQLGVLLAAVGLEYLTWKWWATHVPPVMALLFLIGLPCGLAWAVRRSRIEGRSLVRAGLGFASYFARPRNGRVGGRVIRQRRSTSLTRAWVYVAPGEEQL